MIDRICSIAVYIPLMLGLGILAAVLFKVIP
jgi:hypothetical protein